MKKRIVTSTLALSVLFSGASAALLQPKHAQAASVQNNVNAFQQAWSIDAKMYSDYFKSVEKDRIIFSEQEEWNATSSKILQNALNKQKQFYKQLQSLKKSNNAEVNQIREYYKQATEKDMKYLEALIRFFKKEIHEDQLMKIAEDAANFNETITQKIYKLLEASHKKYKVEPNRDTLYLLSGYMYRYTVEKGDTMTSIAVNHQMTVKELQSLNGLKGTSLKVGQELFVVDFDLDIPEHTYEVEKGDTLYSIAKKHGLSVNTLKQYNNLKSNLIKPEQILFLKKVHHVQKGDTLQKISKKYGVSVTKLKKENGLLIDTLFVGQKLVIV